MKTFNTQLPTTSEAVRHKAVQIVADGGVKIKLRTEKAIRGTVTSTTGTRYETALQPGGYYRCDCVAYRDRHDLCAHVIALRLEADA